MTPLRVNRKGVLSLVIACAIIGYIGMKTAVSYKLTEDLLSAESSSQETEKQTITSKVLNHENSAQYPDGAFPKSQVLAGLVFSEVTAMGERTGEILGDVTLSVVKSLSKPVIDHIKQIFNDDYGENIYFATIPAMVKQGDHIEVVQRIWLAQYEKMKTQFRKEGKSLTELFTVWQNSWQENHLYKMQLDENYNLIRPGEIMGIPTTTNVRFTYKSDGLMDPRLVHIGSDTYLVFHTWMVDKNSENQVAGRIHIWDMERHIKKRLWPHIALQRTEINWIPLDINGELFLTYSIDPLRVMKCNPKDGECQFIYEQEGSDGPNAKFVYANDHLRGGTPWIVYKHPYYISFAHNVAATYKPYQDFAIYNVNLVVLDVERWRIVYVSRNIAADMGWLRSEPVIRNHTILSPFWYPTGIILQTDDIVDISCHLNDASGHILRFRGLEQIMKLVISNVESRESKKSAKVRVVQQYVLEATKDSYKNWTFYGDILQHTVEGVDLNP